MLQHPIYNRSANEYENMLWGIAAAVFFGTMLAIIKVVLAAMGSTLCSKSAVVRCLLVDVVTSMISMDLTLRRSGKETYENSKRLSTKPKMREKMSGQNVAGADLSIRAEA